MITVPGGTPIRSARVLAAVLMSALLIIGIAIFFVLPGSSSGSGRYQTPPHPAAFGWYLGVAILGVVAAVLVSAVGYRARPRAGIDQGSPRSGVAVFQQLMILRFALSEAVAIVSIALTFSSRTSNIGLYSLGAGISLVLMAVHVWPSRRVIAKTERGLDRNGGHSDLSSALLGG